MIRKKIKWVGERDIFYHSIVGGNRKTKFIEANEEGKFVYPATYTHEWTEARNSIYSEETGQWLTQI